jgi:hypothetical protein
MLIDINKVGRLLTFTVVLQESLFTDSLTLGRSKPEQRILYNLKKPKKSYGIHRLFTYRFCLRGI